MTLLSRLESAKSTLSSMAVEQGRLLSCSRTKVVYRNLFFSSYAEALCAAIFERYLANFTLITGDTVHVAIGKGREVDFVVEGIVVEYHEPRFAASYRNPGEFTSYEEYQSFLKELDAVKKNEFRKERLLRATRSRLIANYAKRRREALDENPSYRSSKLVVIESKERIYDSLAENFKVKLPDREKFEAVCGILNRMIHRHTRVARKFHKLSGLSDPPTLDSSNH